MSYTRTETLIMPTTDVTTSVEKPKFSLRGFFGLKTKTAPGSPWPNPPGNTVTINDDDNKKHSCCFPFRKR